MSVARGVEKVFTAPEKAEGMGAKVRRSIGVPQLRNFSPFLMMDHATVAPGAGFPDHPHSGQETITYVLSGSINHEDFTGTSGTINPGDLQFMTAGRGIVHAEIPAPDNTDPNIAVQLWVDLPAHLKTCEPRYRDLRAAEIPHANPNSLVNVKVISGTSHGVESLRELAYTPVWFLDITIKPGGQVRQELPKGWNAFMYILSGAVTVGSGGSDHENTGVRAKRFQNVVFKQGGDFVDVRVGGEETADAQMLLVAGVPLDQEIVQYGPFVQTSQEAIYRNFHDYQNYQNGFERARDWQSKIGEEMLSR